MNEEGIKQPQKIVRLGTRTYEWSGGEKQVDPNDLTAGKRAYVVIKWREGSGERATKGVLDTTSKKLAVIGQTFSVGGVDSQGNNDLVSYFSNETSKWGQLLRVLKRAGNGRIEVAATGDYDDVKKKLGKLVRATYNVYFYDFERKCIDKFKFIGSSYQEWKQFYKTSKQDIYTRTTLMSPGEATAFATGVAIVPKFELATLYADEERATLREAVKKFEEYEVYLARVANEIAEGKALDQTPKTYEGENSQEYQDASEATGRPDMRSIPF